MWISYIDNPTLWSVTWSVHNRQEQLAHRSNLSLLLSCSSDLPEIPPMREDPYLSLSVGKHTAGIIILILQTTCATFFFLRPMPPPVWPSYLGELLMKFFFFFGQRSDGLWNFSPQHDPNFTTRNHQDTSKIINTLDCNSLIILNHPSFHPSPNLTRRQSLNSHVRSLLTYQ